MRRACVALVLALALAGCTGDELSEGEEVVRRPLPPSDGPSGEVCLAQGDVPAPGASPEVVYDCATVPPSARLPLPTVTGQRPDDGPVSGPSAPP